MKPIKSFMLTSLLFATQAFANPGNNNQYQTVDSMNGWVVGLGSLSIDSNSAEMERVDDRAIYLQLGWQGSKQNFVYGAGLGIVFFDDKDSYSQEVEDIWGDVSSESSSALGFSLYGEAGYQFALNDANSVFLDTRAGVEMMWAERSISNCSDCYSEDIDLDAGLYIRPMFKFRNDNHFQFSIGYNLYLSGDLEGGPMIQFDMLY